MAAHRARWYGEKLRRTSASSVSPVNSHRCVLRLPFPSPFLFSFRNARLATGPLHAHPQRARASTAYIYIYKTLLPFRDRPDSPSCHVIDQHPDRAPSCFATKDWTTQKTVAKSPISTFIELRCSTDSQPPTTFLPSSPRFLFSFFSPSSLLSSPSPPLRPPSSNVDRVPTPHTTHPPRDSSVSAKGEA